MSMKHRYEFIVDGEVIDRVTCDSQGELKKVMEELDKYQEKPVEIQMGDD